MFKCKYCKGETDMKVFVPFKESRRLWVGDPKYTFHIKSICFNCHKFNGFLKQTDELMGELKNCTLMNLGIEPRELPFADEESLKSR